MRRVKLDTNVLLRLAMVSATSKPPSACARSCRMPCDQGLTLVHFPAELEPCLAQENTLHTLNTLHLHNPYAQPLCLTKRSS